MRRAWRPLRAPASMHRANSIARWTGCNVRRDDAGADRTDRRRRIGASTRASRPRRPRCDRGRSRRSAGCGRRGAVDAFVAARRGARHRPARGRPRASRRTRAQRRAARRGRAARGLGGGLLPRRYPATRRHAATAARPRRGLGGGFHHSAHSRAGACAAMQELARAGGAGGRMERSGCEARRAHAVRGAGPAPSRGASTSRPKSPPRASRRSPVCGKPSNHRERGGSASASARAVTTRSGFREALGAQRAPARGRRGPASRGRAGRRRSPSTRLRPGREPVQCVRHRVALRAQQAGHDFGHGGIVLDQQQPQRAGRRPCLARGSRLRRMRRRFGAGSAIRR